LQAVEIPSPQNQLDAIASNATSSALEGHPKVLPEHLTDQRIAQSHHAGLEISDVHPPVSLRPTEVSPIAFASLEPHDVQARVSVRYFKETDTQ
jgi:hypothetical protein